MVWGKDVEENNARRSGKIPWLERQAADESTILWVNLRARSHLGVIRYPNRKNVVDWITAKSFGKFKGLVKAAPKASTTHGAAHSNWTHNWPSFLHCVDSGSGRAGQSRGSWRISDSGALFILVQLVVVLIALTVFHIQGDWEGAQCESHEIDDSALELGKRYDIEERSKSLTVHHTRMSKNDQRREASILSVPGTTRSHRSILQEIVGTKLEQG